MIRFTRLILTVPFYMCFCFVMTNLVFNNDNIINVEENPINDMERLVSPSSENRCQVAPAVTSPAENESSAEKRPLTTASLKSKRSQLSQMSSLIDDLKNIDKNLEETGHDVFLKSVSAQLKKLSEEQAIIAQEKIQSILTQCRLANIKAKKPNTAYFNIQQPVQSNMPSQAYTIVQYQQSSYQPALY
ncbi:uncharacterized protein LOC126740949 [Anthonomus grandis grandis]|uniref:uncharacterized protein LOC126740949 n=1 Tax=Anthonomus grandis grandis TaxID=2921223 RepID=UPI002166342A|nr:uncharacterized protein LOC126740949 [Anthonomus grandis grandis]